jgi:hypothetical protein
MVTDRTKDSAEKTERSSRRFWILIILGFFGMDLTIAILAIVMASGDPSFRAIPGFGERAVAWDERRALADAWQKQKWDVQLSCILPERKSIEIAILTEDGHPVSGVRGKAVVFHFTRVAEQQSNILEEVQPGIYRTNLDVSKPGLWNVEILLTTQDGTQCWSEQTVDWSHLSENNRVAIGHGP